ncbi:hypothetical protein HRM2_11760 [Desulforapulum autotrophicum HRM2]|uniref:Guanylate cyclase domain-containing protein n=1 Tax=Desulforapulum autotrophicum (strain ATCC 43914 / DSM 3382 / VKM B-1955 / HRM2) TaxID=177437 RepID=C0QLY2_DESAH|nr:hypothetical protein [Desulforapulum autotrophicum]ACN14288.1 hypothetical protein HRM2_11760 [Desulforapulum autotrophicum HRM2]
MDNRIIAFLDILGFKKLVADNQEELLLKFISPLYFAEESNNDQKTQYQKFGLDELHTREVTFFSDSIIISCEFKEILHLISHVKDLSAAFIKYGLFLRGGITYGELYHKDRVVFGSAMNEAYMIESEHAIYPRIIISDNLFKKIECEIGPISEALKSADGPYERLMLKNNIFKDDDGFYFLNPFPNSVPINAAHKQLGINSLNDFIVFLKAKIEQSMAENRADKKIALKYFWLASNFNNYYLDVKGISAIEI